jgi:hypothetical protein
MGRKGSHKYYGQDHPMLTGMLAIRNILGEKHDIRFVNADLEYHEKVTYDHS